MGHLVMGSNRTGEPRHSKGHTSSHTNEHSVQTGLLRNQAMVGSRPCSSDTVGCQPNSC